MVRPSSWPGGNWSEAISLKVDYGTPVNVMSEFGHTGSLS